ncbi:hypothetical protein N7453_005583 [Penicillium expansum]|nr:hypothetical protein N7453_005583 [Penicillium expansum]
MKRDATGIADAQKVEEREAKKDYIESIEFENNVRAKTPCANLGCGSFVTPNSSLPLHFHLQLATPFVHPSFSISHHIRISLWFLPIPAFYLDN